MGRMTKNKATMINPIVPYVSKKKKGVDGPSMGPRCGDLAREGQCRSGAKLQGAFWPVPRVGIPQQKIGGPPGPKYHLYSTMEQQASQSVHAG